MPTYDYKCDACGHAFEKFQSMSAAPVKKCPQCGATSVKRLIGIGAGVIFKGGGFYETDYRSDAYKKDAKKAGGEGGGDTKRDAKESGTGEAKAGGATEAKSADPKPATATPPAAPASDKSSGKKPE